MLTVVTQFDSDFFDWAKLSLESLKISNPDASFFGYSVNLSAEQLKEANKCGMKMICEKIDFSNFTLDEKKAFMANRRTNVACMALRDLNPSDEDIIIIADADIIYRKKMIELKKIMQFTDVGCIFRDGSWNGKIYNHLKIACGFVVFKKSGKELANLWNTIMNCETKAIYNIAPHKWFWDQVTLIKAIEQLNNLKYVKLDHDTYVNRDFNENAISWSAHKPPKELMFEKFQIELRNMKHE